MEEKGLEGKLGSEKEEENNLLEMDQVFGTTSTSRKENKERNPKKKNLEE